MDLIYSEDTIEEGKERVPSHLSIGKAASEQRVALGAEPLRGLPGVIDANQRISSLTVCRFLI